MNKLFFLKLVVTAGLLVFLLWKIDLTAIWETILEVQLWLATVSIIILFLQFGLATLRWHAVAMVFAIRASKLTMWRYYLIGQCFTQVLPSSVGGDVIRTWLLKRDGNPLRTSIFITLSDRIIGVAVLLALLICVLFLPVAKSLDATLRASILVTCIIGLAAPALLILFNKLPENWLASSRYTRLGRDLSQGMWEIFVSRRLLRMGALSIAIHILTIVAVWLLSIALALDIDPLVLAVTMPIALLAATIPISIGGWGVREGVLVALLGAYGIPADSAFTLSLLYGVAMIVASLPGAFVWFTSRARSDEDAGEVKNIFRSY